MIEEVVAFLVDDGEDGQLFGCYKHYLHLFQNQFDK